MSSRSFPDEKIVEELFLERLQNTESSKTLFQLGYYGCPFHVTKDTIPDFLERIIDNLIKKEKIIEIHNNHNFNSKLNRTFILTRKERLDELLERIESNENEWCDWINLANYYYERCGWDNVIICMEMVEKKLGNLFESTVRLKHKKKLAWAYMHKAFDIINYETYSLNSKGISSYHSNQKKAKELFYKASKIYTNFYDEQPKTVQNEHKIFGHKDQGKRYHVDAELSNLTYEMIEGVPIYYIILRDLYHTFGITYEELTQDIKNKLL
jgi:hypothetical protein